MCVLLEYFIHIFEEHIFSSCKIFECFNSLAFVCHMSLILVVHVVTEKIFRLPLKVAKAIMAVFLWGIVGVMFYYVTFRYLTFHTQGDAYTI